METISVIIPVYNSGKYLERCFDSLLRQDIKETYKVYIIDDGSTDNSAIISRNYCENYPSLFTYYYKANGGISSARNYGLDISESKYVVFVDSDDYVEDNYLSILLQLCMENDAQLSMCGMNRVYGDDGIGRRFSSGFSSSFVSEEIDSLLLTSSFAAWNKMISRELIGDLRFPDGITYEDFALIPQIMNRAKRIAYNHTILYHYYANPNSIISMANRCKITDRNIINAQHILEKSDLKDKPLVLENLYLRRVLSSMAWSLLEYNEGNDKVQILVNEAYEKYPNIKKNPYISSSPFILKVFLMLILSNRIEMGAFWVKQYCLLRQIINRFRKRNH